MIHIPRKSTGSDWSWKQALLFFGGLAVLLFFLRRWDAAEEEQSAAEFAQSVPAQLEPAARDIMTRACRMRDWVDHLEQKTDVPLPAKLTLSDGNVPWEKLPQLDDALAETERKLEKSQQLQVLLTRDKLSRLRDAGEALRFAATDLTTALAAADSGEAATAQAKFESARKQAQKAVDRAEQVLEPLPTEPILEGGGGAVIMTTEDPCGAL